MTPPTKRNRNSLHLTLSDFSTTPESPRVMEAEHGYYTARIRLIDEGAVVEIENQHGTLNNREVIHTDQEPSDPLSDLIRRAIITAEKLLEKNK